MSTRVLLALAAATSVGLATASARAAVIGSENFDAQTDPGTLNGTAYNGGATGFSGEYDGSGQAVFSTGGISFAPSLVPDAAAGKAFQMQAVLPPHTSSFTGDGSYFGWYWGVYWGSSWRGNSNAGGTAVPLSEVTVSFDLKASAPGTLDRFQVQENNGGAGQTLNLDATVPVTTGWTTYTTTLDKLVPDDGNTAPFSVTDANFTFGFTMGQGLFGFGDPANPTTVTLTVDNFQVSIPDAPIPEPASLGLLGLGALALLRRR